MKNLYFWDSRKNVIFRGGGSLEKPLSRGLGQFADLYGGGGGGYAMCTIMDKIFETTLVFM